MSPALWGAVTALGWGCADFMARFTGRAVGHHAALFGMLAVSAVVFSVVLAATGPRLVWDAGSLWLLIVTGLGLMSATLMLYWALARGPVTVVAPIVGCYPVVNLLFAVVVGVRPSVAQWAAMAAVMAGVVTVARAASSFENEAGFTARDLRKTIVISLISGVGFAITVAAAQAAGRIYGELATVCWTRWISLVAIVLLMAWRRQAPRIPTRWWPVIGLQGLLDGSAYVAVVLGGAADGAEIAVVVASAFSAVTVVLARLVLKEAMTWAQWAGIVLIVAGVAALAAP